MYYMKTLHKIYSFTTLHNTIYTNELSMNNELIIMNIFRYNYICLFLKTVDINDIRIQ